MVRIVRHPYGARLYILRRRVHHGPLGAALAVVALAAGRRRVALAFLAYGATDWRDWPFRDADNHAPRRHRRRVPARGNMHGG
jgi:hypothetical protein